MYDKKNNNVHVYPLLGCLMPRPCVLLLFLTWKWQIKRKENTSVTSLPPGGCQETLVWSTFWTVVDTANRLAKWTLFSRGKKDTRNNCLSL